MLGKAPQGLRPVRWSPVLADEKASSQHRIFDTVANGRVMTLDDIVQITSWREAPMPTC